MAPFPHNYRRAHELVGQYMSQWSIIEAGLTNVIDAGCFMDAIFGAVVSANTAVRDKIAIARSAVALSLKHAQWQKMADYVLLKVSDASVDRNMIAHTMFDAPDDGDGDGAIFIRRFAKSGLKFEKTRWCEAKFNETFATLTTLRRHLDDMEHDLKQIPYELFRDVLDGKNPSMPRFSPDRLSVELPPPPDDPPNDPPKPLPKSERRKGQRESEVRVLRKRVAELEAALAKQGG
jgi:hypothetical protein